MAKISDIRVQHVELTFSDERLAVPLRLSRGTITDITYAKVNIRVSTRSGHSSYGTGAILLSDLWSFPTPCYIHAQKDAAMRVLCGHIATFLESDGEYADPLQKGHLLESALPKLLAHAEQKLSDMKPGDIPFLAALNCLAPFDAAIHDAWACALGGSAYSLYTADWLNADLSVYLGDEFEGLYPDAFLSTPRCKLRVQHVVGVGDPLTPDQVNFADSQNTQLPQDLIAWVTSDKLTCFKVKTRGQDPIADAVRVSDVYTTALAAGASPSAVHLSVDPNEACRDANFLLEMLDHLAAAQPAAIAALDYIEQPTGRDLERYTFTLHAVARRKPVIIDESLDRLDNLARLAPLGWSGLAVKTCKGQTHSLLAYCYAKHQGMYITLQDLTNPGLALVHSANLWAHLDLAVDYFECNSRQYMPHARQQEQLLYPEYFRTHNGQLHLPHRHLMGLY